VVDGVGDVQLATNGCVTMPLCTAVELSPSTIGKMRSLMVS